MNDRPARRGQANVITLMILISVTVALAIILYSYFSGVYTRQATTQAMVDAVSHYVNYVSVNLDVFSAENVSTGAGPTYLYCAMLTIKNLGGDPLSPYITVLPGEPIGGLIRLNNSISRIPLDYTQTPPQLRLYAWYVLDYNAPGSGRDGILDMVVESPGGNLVRVANRTLSCLEIYSNGTLTSPGHYLEPRLVEVGSIIVDIPTGLRFTDLVRQAYPQADETFEIPFWKVTVEPLETKVVYFYLESPVKPPALTLVVAGPFNEDLLVASYLVLYYSP